MHSVPDKNAPPRWGLDGLRYGVMHTLALLPGTAVFGMAYGTVAAQKGLTFAEAAAMSAFVFSGAAQLVAMEIWSHPITLGTILTLAAATFVVGLAHGADGRVAAALARRIAGGADLSAASAQHQFHLADRAALSRGGRQ